MLSEAGERRRRCTEAQRQARWREEGEVESKEDLFEDFVSLVTSFCARIYGRRRSKRKTEELLKKLESEEVGKNGDNDAC